VNPAAPSSKTILQVVWDFIGSPFRLLFFDQAWLPTFGWTTLEDERFAMVWPHLSGRLLDVGAGLNTLVKRYGNGVGVDVFEWGGGALLVEDTSKLPFDDASFDTVTFLACLNHIPYRDAAVREARRVIKPDGRLVLTMINPIIGDVGHKIWWYSEDKHRGGMLPGETGGLWPSHVIAICEQAGFVLKLHRRFVYGMNHLFVFDVDPSR
jgi:SAM-dependent methyltransferase